MSNRLRFFTGTWPVIQRELREGARRPFNYWLRVGGAGGAIAVLKIIYSTLEMSAGSGLQTFTSLHTLLLLLIWWMVPAMTSDCIAREKRDGTLGLLFMTPLTAGGIVAGKSLVQGFRAFTLWLAVIPVLSIPFLMGGIGWLDISTAISLEFSTTALCLAAGLLASSLTKNRMAAFFIAMTLATVLIFLLGGSLAELFYHYAVRSGVANSYEQRHHLEFLLQGSYFLMTGMVPNLNNRDDSGWSTLLVRLGLGVPSWPVLFLITVGLSVLALFLVGAFAARCIRRSWKDLIPSSRQTGLVKRFCTPLLPGRFSRKMKRTMDRNPIAWLQQYSWKTRVSKWGLCLVFVLGETAVFTANVNNPGRLLDCQFIFLAVLALVFTHVAINSFMMEKQNGALELILITPLRVEQIIFGRAWGLWKLFLPAGLILGASAMAGSWLANAGHYYYYGQNDFEGGQFYVAGCVALGFFNLPVFATYCALRVKNLVAAAVLTWVMLLIAPLFGVSAGGLWGHLFFDDFRPSDSLVFFGIFMGNIGCAFLTCFLLRHSLSRRIYSF